MAVRDKSKQVTVAGKGTSSRSRARGSASAGRVRNQGSAGRGRDKDVPSKQLKRASQITPSWEYFQNIAGRPATRVFEEKERLFGAKAPELKFWHDAAGWC